MDANEFLSQLKADGSEHDVVLFDDALTQYRDIAGRLKEAETSVLALNVLCMMCRNLEKAPQFGVRSDSASMLCLCASVLSDIKNASQAERIRALAALYHLHRYATKQKVQPELVLKLSAYVFKDEPKDLLKEYCKTYWAILADKLSYVEKLKLAKLNVKKLIPNLTNDVIKTIFAYNTAQFCTESLAILIKKLYHLFSEIASKELNAMFSKIFEAFLAKKDLKECSKKITDVAILDLFRKVNECFSTVAENASKCQFDSCALTVCVRFALTLLGHRSDIYYCWDAFYVNGYCNILENKHKLADLLKSLQKSTGTVENLGYEAVAKETYPYLNQIVRMHIEYTVHKYDKKEWLNLFSIESQSAYLKFIISLMKKLRRSPQILKCENCALKSGLHDALRLSFSVRHFIINSLKHEMDITQTLPLICEAIDEQKSIITELQRAKCANAEKCRFKMQTDTHNNAILLYRSRYYEYSNKLFDIYICGEIFMYANVGYSERPCLSRAFYNKAICELDMLNFDSALRSAFLSLAFTDDSGLKGDKYMSFVIDVKSKALNVKKVDESVEENDPDGLQMMTVLDACLKSCEMKEHGDLKPLLCTVEFSTLLEHEFSRYGRVWPSLEPIVGVWKSLDELLERTQPDWMIVEDYESLLWTACEVALTTPMVARTIHHPRLGECLQRLVERLDKSGPKSLQFMVAKATLLLLKAEFDIAEAKTKYGWRSSAKSVAAGGKEECPAISQTLPQEYEALRKAVEAVDVWTGVLSRLGCDVPPQGQLSAALRNASRVASVFVVQLLHYERTTHALQLAHVCVEVASRIGDWELYACSLGALLSESLAPCAELDSLMDTMNQRLEEMLKGEGTRDVALCYMCDAAVYLCRSGDRPLAAAMVRYVQLALLSAERVDGSAALERACGRLLEAQQYVARERGGPCVLTGLNVAHKHCLARKCSGGASWAERRARGAHMTYSGALTGERCVAGAARLLLCRRARAYAAPALRLAAAGRQARLHAALAVPSAAVGSDVQIKIDTIKSILEIKPLKICTKSITAETAHTLDSKTVNTKSDTIEAVLDATVFKKTQNGPASPYFDVPAFTMPDFLSHVKFCDCFACQNPWCAVIALQMCGIEASMYFRNEEVTIARNYYCGVLKMFAFVEAKIGHFFEDISKKLYENYVSNIAKDIFTEELDRTKVQILIECAFFETSEGNLDSANVLTIDIFKIIDSMQENDPYLHSEALNLLCMLEYLKNNKTKIKEVVIEKDFESLKLSPPPSVVVVNAKTPEIKVIPPKLTKERIIINQDDLPHVKRKVIKLNLDVQSPSDGEEPSKPEMKTKKFFKSKDTFKIPVPKTSEAVPEIINPRMTRGSKLPISKTNKLKSQSLETGIKERKQNATTGAADKKCQIPNLKITDSSTTDTLTENIKSDEIVSKMSELKINLTDSKQSDEPIDEVFSTPMSKPIAKTEDQFFTPMTSIKTYTKKTLRHQVIKNLEVEFQSPNATPQPAKVLSPTETPIIFERTRRAKKSEVDTSSGSDVENKPRKNLSNSKVSPIENRLKKQIGLDPPTGPKEVSAKNNSDIKSDPEKRLKKVDVSKNARTQKTDAVLSKLRVNDKRRLKRATSPGKLSKEDIETPKETGRPVRGTRLQQLQK